MFKNIIRIYIVVCFVSGAARSNAQSSPQFGGAGDAASVTLPVLSFVLDTTAHRLRPLIGIPGAASIGPAQDLGFDVIQASMPPAHDYILAMTNESDWPMLLQVRGGMMTAGSIDTPVNRRQSRCGVVPDAPLPRRGQTSECPLESRVSRITIDGIAISPAGSAAGFFSESQRRIFVYTNLSQSPALLGTFEVDEPGRLSAFGVSDDGRTVAFGMSDGVTGSLFLLERNSPKRLIASMRHPSVIAFLHKSGNAIIADDVENKVYMLSGGQALTIATAEDGISGPIGIAASNDNQRIFVGNSKSGSVTTLVPNGTVAESRDCNCTLMGLYPTNADSVFRLTDFANGPVLLFDASSTAPRMIFVPVAGSRF